MPDLDLSPQKQSSPTLVDTIKHADSERRSNHRKVVEHLAQIHHKHQVTGCLIHDISEHGAKLQHSLVCIPERFVLHNYVNGERVLCQVVWRKSGFTGVRFLSEPRILPLKTTPRQSRDHGDPSEWPKPQDCWD